MSVCDVERFPLNAPVDENVAAAEVRSVPAITVLPVAAATVNLLVLTVTPPVSVRLPVDVMLPLAAVTTNALDPTVKFPSDVSAPLNEEAPLAGASVNAVSLP